MAYALDTNCLLRWVLDDNEDQAKRIDELLSRSSQALQVADMALAEMVWVLKSVYHFDDPAVADFLETVIENKKINCNRVLFQKVLEDYHGTPKVSFVYLCLTHYAQLSGAKKLLTFDKTLAKRFPKLVELA